MDGNNSRSARILPFDPARRRIATLSPGDRIQALRWLDMAREFGIRHVRVFDSEPGDGASVDPFLLVYRTGEAFAAWGVARRRLGYEVWRTGCGTTLGLFDTMMAALDAVACKQSLGRQGIGQALG